METVLAPSSVNKYSMEESRGVDMSAPWRSQFVRCDGDFHGYVYDVQSAMDPIEEFAYHTHTSYVTTRATKNFGSSQL